MHHWEQVGAGIVNNLKKQISSLLILEITTKVVQLVMPNRRKSTGSLLSKDSCHPDNMSRRKYLMRYIKKVFGIIDKKYVFEVNGSTPKYYEQENDPRCSCKLPKKVWVLSWAHANSWYLDKRADGFSWWTCKKCKLWGAYQQVPWYKRFELRTL